MYPKLFEKLIEDFMKLPGVGQKTATRYAFEMLENSDEFIKEFSEDLRDLKSKVKRCEVCGFLSEDDRCDICKDEDRDRSMIMVVTNVQDVVAVEKTRSYNGLYHVLGGNVNTAKGILPSDLNIDSLLRRIGDGVKEVIIAISPTMDGEITALYLSKLLKDYEIKVTRLASGLPMGANLDYTDDITITKALTNRVDIGG
ncbi:MAG: recombination protein RecR [Erysipelotrichaceae bacterium]|nr:recombination protein RecR [Erysipelotrichaceae bacterium]